jgi:alcohol dehydrogenase class IV
MHWQSFEHTNPRTRILAGIGSADRLPEVMADLGVGRALIVCGPTVAAGPQSELVRSIAGDRVVATFSGVTTHGGMQGLLAGVRAVQEHQADSLLTVGGGAAIDTAKCIALLYAVGDEPLEQFRVREADGVAIPGRPVPPTMVHIALPTTAGSSSEVMPWAGIRDEERREKMLFRDPQLTPPVAILDPRLVADTNPWLTATSGVTSIARSIETLYSKARQPISQALALDSLRLMVGALPTAVASGDDLDARADTQVASSMSGIAADNSMVSLVHAVGHTVGGRLGLQHGLAHAILLPHAARLYFPTLSEPLVRQVADALGVDPAGRSEADCVDAAVEALRAVLAGLPIPSRLRDVGVPEDAIDDLAEQTVHDPMFGFVPLATSVDDVREVLTRAW